MLNKKNDSYIFLISQNVIQYVMRLSYTQLCNEKNHRMFGGLYFTLASKAI